MPSSPTWHVFLGQVTQFTRVAYSLKFVNGSDSFDASAEVRWGKGVLIQLAATCHGIPLAAHVGPVREEYSKEVGTQKTSEGEVRFGETLRGELIVRDGRGYEPYVEFTLPGLMEPVCLVNEIPGRPMSPLEVMRLKDAVATLYPDCVGRKTPCALRSMAPKSHRYYGWASLKRDHATLSETSRCALTVLTVVADAVVNGYMAPPD